jgi:hypothetical protein
MDSSLVSFEVKDNYLLIVGHGKRDNLASMAQASAQIYAKVLETKTRYLLVDYRRLQINVHMSEAFNIVKRYEVIQPELKNLKMAAVFGGKGLTFGHYWRDIAQQRGFTIEIFDDYQKAEEWLNNQIKNN